MALMKLLYDHCEFKCPNQQYGCNFIYSGGDKSMSSVHLGECNRRLQEMSSEDYDDSASVSTSAQHSSDSKDDLAQKGKSDRACNEKVINKKVLRRHDAQSSPLSNEQKSNIDLLSEKCLYERVPSHSSSLWTITQTDTGITPNDLLDPATSEREESATSQKSNNTNTTKVVPCYDEEYVDNRKYIENRSDEEPRLTTEQILSRASTHESGASFYSGRGSSTVSPVVRGKISPIHRELFRF